MTEAFSRLYQILTFPSKTERKGISQVKTCSESTCNVGDVYPFPDCAA
jgi:hypothetical protein